MRIGTRRINRQRIVEGNIEEDDAQENVRDINQSTCKHRSAARLSPVPQANDRERCTCQRGAEEQQYEP